MSETLSLTCIDELRAKYDGHTWVDGNCNSQFPLLCLQHLKKTTDFAWKTYLMKPSYVQTRTAEIIYKAASLISFKFTGIFSLTETVILYRRESADRKRGNIMTVVLL